MTSAAAPLGQVVLAAHGSADPRGRAALDSLASRLRRPGEKPPVVGHVDVGDPLLADVLSDLSGPVTVVPLFLTAGYHVEVDIPGACAAYPDVQVTPHLGAAPGLPALLATVARGVEGVDAVVLATAGSSRDTARAEVARLAGRLSELLGMLVEVGTLSGPVPSLEDAAVRLRRAGARRVLTLTHLLAPGRLEGRLRARATSMRLRGPSQTVSELPAVAEVVEELLAAAGRSDVAPGGR